MSEKEKGTKKPSLKNEFRRVAPGEGERRRGKSRRKRKELT